VFARSFTLSVARKYLEPGDSLTEILFGLIMTLTFTLAAGRRSGGRSTPPCAPG
jgi:hypothetical protein